MPYIAPLRLRSTYYETDDITTLFRPRKADGTLVTDALVDEWDLFVYNLKDSGTPLTTLYELLAQSPSGVLFSSLQNQAGGDGYWDEDSIGYTFRHTLEYADRIAFTTPFFLEGGKAYLLEYKLHLTTGEILTGTHIVDAETVRNE